MSVDVRRANLLPSRASTPVQARSLVALDGAALVSNLPTVDDAVEFATAMLGERAVKVAPQFEATKAAMDVSGPIVAAQPVDERGWTTTAVAIPDITLDITEPVIPMATAR